MRATLHLQLGVSLNENRIMIPGLTSRPFLFAALVAFGQLFAANLSAQIPVIVRCDQTTADNLQHLAQGGEPLFPSLGLGPVTVVEDNDSAMIPDGVSLVLTIKPMLVVDTSDKQYRTLLKSMTERRSIGGSALESPIRSDLDEKSLKGLVSIPWALLDAETSKPLIEDRLVWPVSSESPVDAQDKQELPGLTQAGYRQGLRALDRHLQETAARKILTKLTVSRTSKDVVAEFSNRLPFSISGSVRILTGNITATDSFDVAASARATRKFSLLPASTSEPSKGTKSADNRGSVQLRFEDVRLAGSPARLFVRHQLLVAPERIKNTAGPLYSYSEVAVSGNADVVAVLQQNQVKLLHRQTGLPEMILETGLKEGALRELSVSPDGQLVAATHSTNRLFLWDRITGQFRDIEHLPQTETADAWFLDNDRLVIRVMRGKYGQSVWPVSSGEMLFHVGTRSDFVASVENGIRYHSYDRIEEQIGSSRSRSLMQLKLPDQPRDRHVSSHKGSFSTGGSRVATSFILRESMAGKGYSPGHETELGVWDVAAGTLLRHQSLAPRQILAVALSPDGRTVAATVFDPRANRPAQSPRLAVLLWDVESNTPANVQALPAPASSTSTYHVSPGNGQNHLRFSQDGKTLAGMDQVARRAFVYEMASPATTLEP